MIVVDTSALIEILAGQPLADICAAALEQADALAISAGTLTEALIVARSRDLGSDMEAIFERIEFEIVPVTAETASQAAVAYGTWGKGFHPAALNFGDCFAYALAMEREAPLLFVGNDFSRTDVLPAL